MNRSYFIARAELAQVFSPAAVRQFEEMQETVAAVGATVTANLEATGGLKDATFVTLSANTELPNERVLSLGDGLAFSLTDGGVTISLSDVPRVDGGFSARFVTGGDTLVALPLTGTLATRQNVETFTNKTLEAPKLSGLVNAADDAAAATAGVPSEAFIGTAAFSTFGSPSA